VTDADLLAIDQRIQRAGAANCWTGTLGSLASDARRLVRHIQEERKMAGYPEDHILRGEAELRSKRYTGDESESDAFVVGVEAVHEIDSRNYASRNTPTLRPLRPRLSSPARHRLIGLCGPAGCGKDTVAEMIPDSCRIAYADPLYRGISAMLGIPEHILRDRSQKEKALERIGKSPRQLLQTIGTEWGRNLVSTTIWVDVAVWSWERASADGHEVIVVPDVRFPNEAKAIRDKGGEVWLVHRPDVSPVAGHVSETGIPLSQIDRLVSNAGTLDELMVRVHATLAAPPQPPEKRCDD